MADVPTLAQPLPLLIAHAPSRDRAWHALCWQIDDIMARTVLGAREGAMAAIRLAWWEEALTATEIAAPADPILKAWHSAGVDDAARQAIGSIAGAWRMLLDPAPMTEKEWLAFGAGRGALFRLIARSNGDQALADGGALWALWDVAGKDADRQRAEGAFAAGIGLAERPVMVSGIRPKPLALATGMALDDLRAWRMPDGRFVLSQYLRLLRRAFFF
jgi:phytoene synthase